MIAWQTLLGNLSSVGLFISVWMHFSYRHYRLSKTQLQFGFGVTIGVCILSSMVQSVALVEGVFFDLRVSLLVLSGIFGGPLSLGVTTALAIVARVSIGGAGTIPGVYGILIVSGIVLALRMGTGRRFKRFPGLLALACISAVLSLIFLVFLPQQLLEKAVTTVVGPIALVNFIATIASGLVMIYFSKFTLERDILRAALTQAPDFHYVKDRDCKFVVTNLNVARHNGRQKSSEMVGLSDFDISPDRAPELFDVEQRLMASGEALRDHEECIRQPDGTQRWYTSSKVVLRNRHGELVGLSGVTRDITLRKKLEDDLLASRNVMSQAMAEMSDGLAMFDPDGFLVFCNEQYRAAFPRSAYARKEGAHIRDIVRAVVRNGERKDAAIDVEESFIEAAASTLHTNKDEEIPLFNDRWLSVRTRLAQDGSSLVVVSDITAMKQSEQALKQLADHMRGLAVTDGLTGLANRRSFDESLEGACRTAFESKTPLTLLMVDVDRFKAFNDRYGHQAGDQCLAKVGECLRHVSRRAGDVVARYGGEEFAVILPNTTREAAVALAEAFRIELLRRAVPHVASEFGVVTASVGIATLEPDQTYVSPANLVERADTLLYEAKTDGRNRVVSRIIASPSRARF